MITILLASSLFYWNEFSDIHSAYGPRDWVNYGHGAVPNASEHHRNKLVIPKRKKKVIVEDLEDIEDGYDSEDGEIEVEQDEF